MAIGFARLEFVQRTAGQTACCKAAYNARERIYFEGTQFLEPKTYDWSYREKPLYHALLLPEHIDQSFHSIEKLWNAVEQKENRVNSVLAMEMVLALPDDKTVSAEDKIELANTFIKENFTKKGLIAQIDIHYPDKGNCKQQNADEMEKFDHNWHAHVLLTTRRIKENGMEFEEHKARDMMNDMRGGRVNFGNNWGKLWAHHQNHFFEAKGLDLRVDHNGIVAQKHIGPIRMRSRAFALEEENQTLSTLNQFETSDPAKILEKLTETKSLFSIEDLERFLQKHCEEKLIDSVRDQFWNLKNIIQLINPTTKKVQNKFTTSEIIEEEKQIMRLSDRIHQNKAFSLKQSEIEPFKKGLNPEQNLAFDHITHGKKLSCIEGHAGAGKSYLLLALKKVYAHQGLTVRIFGPDNATVNLLKEKGKTQKFDHCENIYHFLFALHHGKREITKGKEVWIIDESGKLGNRPLLELLKAAEKNKVQLIFAGCTAQLPSVERGGLFKTFCERYGAEELIEVQRQKNLEQRAMAKSLALGNMAHALDKLSHLHGIKWSEKKEEAIEKLIKEWAFNQAAFPLDTVIILAHTNAEVRILNEMARLYLKQRGELGEEEYVCHTMNGKKIIVSEGDKIEFRKKDLELGIENGMQGTLIEASPERFVVALKQESKKITFDPQKYHSFQLSYATTYHRSQGKTLDRVYVLYSPQMNKEKFYVTLTRHAQRVNLYASRDEITCMADLKRQAYRKNPRETTLEYSTLSQLEKEKENSERKDYVDQLKDSEKIVKKIKGYTLDAWDGLKEKLKNHKQNIHDVRPSKNFFIFDLEKNSTKGLVVKIEDQYFNDHQKCQMQQTFSEIIEKSEQHTKTFEKQNRINWKKLDEQTKELLNQYYQTHNQAAILYSFVQAEKKENKNSSYFKEWQTACVVRNQQAYALLKTTSTDLIKEAIGKNACQTLHERALKHESTIERNQKVCLSEIVKDHLDVLLFRLFPDGPTGRDSQGLRFGSKGSLSIVCKGEQKGIFYDFEKGEGGGLIKLVERTLNINQWDAINWVKEIINHPNEVKLPSPYPFKHFHTQHTQDWTCLKPESAFPAPTLKELSSALNQHYHEVKRHAYLDEKGDLLFYVLRLVDKKNPEMKSIRPLSFGQWQGAEKPCWCLKNYQSEKRPVYHLDQLTKNPLSKVLVVEGEKTADAAKEFFKDHNFVVVTWQGGASAVLKTDWMPLTHREVIIWPDNDQAGFKAAHELCNALRKVGVKSLNLVEQKMLKDFPDKWDLADPLPANKSSKDLHQMLFTSKEKSLGFESLNAFLKGHGKEFNAEKLYAQEILYRVEERLWNDLENKHGDRVWEIRKEVFSEVQYLYLQKEVCTKQLIKNEQFSPELAERMSHMLILQQAGNGKAPTTSQVVELKNTIASLKHSGNHTNFIASHACDKVIVESLQIGMNAENMSKNLAVETKESMNSIATQTKIFEKQISEIKFSKQKDRILDI